MSGSKIQNVFKFLFPSSKAWVFWVLAALLFKGLIFFIELHDHSVDSVYQIPGFIGGTWGDSKSYLDPVVSFVSGKGYSSEVRLPGYAVFFIPFNYFFSIGKTCNIVIVLQYIVAAISVYALALSVRNIFKSEILFIIVFYAYATSCFANCYDYLILTESFATSFLVFAVYFFSRYYANNKLSNLIFSGLFLTWLVFLRPVYVPLLALFILLIWLNSKKTKPIIVFLLTFLVIDGSWIVRNWFLYSRVIPFSKTMHYFGENSYFPSVLEFCGAWGGYRSPTQTWLLPELSGDNFDPKIPVDIYTSKFNFDSLKEIRELIKKVTIDSAGVAKKQQDEYTAEIQQKLALYTRSIKLEKPLLYYYKAPLVLLTGSVSIAYYSIVYLNKYTIFWSKWFYYCTLLFGAIGFVMLIKKSFSDYCIVLFWAIPVFTIAIHALVFRVSENRYIVPSYPFIVVCAAYCLFVVYNKTKVKQKYK